MVDPVMAWMSTRDTLSGALRGKGWEQWLPEARLLIALHCSHSYAWQIQNAFQRRRGSTLLLSCLDWMLVDIWGGAGVPLVGVLRGMDEAFNGFERGPGNATRRINSLQFCHQLVMRETELLMEAAVGSHSELHDLSQGKTFLVALPPSGRKIFAALQHQEKMEQVAGDHGFGLVLTVYPDAWQKAQAFNREGINLEFMDPEPSTRLLSSHGSSGRRDQQRDSRRSALRRVNG